MKILHLVSTMNPAAGGPAEAIRVSAVEMNNRGKVQADVASLDAAHAVTPAGLHRNYYPLGPKIGAYGHSKIFREWLDSEIENYDAVICHGLWEYIGFAGSRAALRSKTPYFVFPHGMLGTWFKSEYPIKHIKKKIYWRAIEHRNLHRANAVLFTCEEERMAARNFSKRYAVKEIVVGLGCEAPNINTRIDRIACAKIHIESVLAISRQNPSRQGNKGTHYSIYLHC